jgi:hypothetical protein
MKKVELTPKKHGVRIGNKTGFHAPTITQDSLFVENGEVVGFYVHRMPDRLCDLANIANKEFLSKAVPKSIMNRTSGEQGHTEKVKQFSTIIGAVPPRPHMKRPYPSISKVHSVKSARTFIKAMMMISKASGDLIKDLWPEQYDRQKQLLTGVDKEWRWTDLFTSSISNYNISAPVHRDTGNIKGTVNVIITKRRQADGGSLYIPDYDVCVEQADNSMLVYPAWRNIHGVTPVINHGPESYRNTLIFYALKAFINKES